MVLFIAWTSPNLYQMSPGIGEGVAQMRVCTERLYEPDGSGPLLRQHVRLSRQGLSPESQGQNLGLTVLRVSYSLDSGLRQTELSQSVQQEE